MDVTLSDGTRIRASSILERDDSTRAFGLYMDERWDPTWPAKIILWPDFGLPAHPEYAASQIQRAYAHARCGETVEIGCIGGRGRTGPHTVRVGLGQRASRLELFGRAYSPDLRP